MGWLGAALGGAQIAGDIFGLFGNKPKGLEEGQKALDAVAQSAIPQGMEATGRALSYEEALLGGDPAAQAAAIAPQVNAASAQSEQAKKAISSKGTARGGGVNAQIQAAEDLPTKTTVDTLTALQPQAATAVGSIGSDLTHTGVGAAGTEEANALALRQQKQDFLGGILGKMSIPGGGPPGTGAPTDTGGGFQPTDINPAPTGTPGVAGVPPGGPYTDPNFADYLASLGGV